MTTATLTVPARHETPAQPPVTLWEHLAALLPLEDLTHAAGTNRLLPAVRVPATSNDELLVHSDPYDVAARTLYRSRRANVLLTGRRGVGKTTFVRELARRAATGEVPFLTGRRFVWIDCRNVGPEDSRACLESIFTAVASTPDVVLCLDGLAALLKRTQGGTVKFEIRSTKYETNSKSEFQNAPPED